MGGQGGECAHCSLLYLSLPLPPYWSWGEPKVAECLLSTSFMSLNLRMNSIRYVSLMTVLPMRPLRLREIKNLFSRSHSSKQGLRSLKSRALPIPGWPFCQTLQSTARGHTETQTGPRPGPGTIVLSLRRYKKTPDPQRGASIILFTCESVMGWFTELPGDDQMPETRMTPES